MPSPKYRHCLPQLRGARLLTDGGIEKALTFHEGFDLPLFASFILLKSVEGRRGLRRYYRRYIKVAHGEGLGLVLDSPTWRASRDWGAQLGYDADDLAAANRKAIEMLVQLRTSFEAGQPFVISGSIGPRADGYPPQTMMTPAEAADYHADQIASFDAAGVDMISAITMTHTGEAMGIARAAAERGVPLTLSFTVETDGRLPSGQPLKEAIREVDADPSGGPAYYMINCAHPDHFRSVLEPGAAWTARIYGLRANASRLSHAELDAAEALDEGDPQELANDYADLLALLPNLRVFGGGDGTDYRHVHAIAKACVPPLAA